MRAAVQQETEKFRSPVMRSAFARALAAARSPAAVESSEDTAAQVQRALRNYEDFHSLAPGTAVVEDVANSSAGVSGWAGVGFSRGNVGAIFCTDKAQGIENIVPSSRFTTPSIVEEMALSNVSRPTSSECGAVCLGI